MKKALLLATTALLLHLAPAHAEDLLCQVKLNLQVVAEPRVTVEMGETVTYAEIDSYRLKAKNLGMNKFEIEVYDGAATTRSYAGGLLKTAEDQISWALWSREILLETSCRLAS